MIDRILGDLRVVELPGAATLFCGKLFADLGAQVLKLEPPGGDPARKLPPFIPYDEYGAGVSTTWLSYDIGKLHEEIDLETIDGRQRLLELASSADVLLHGMTAAQAAALGLDCDALRERNPDLIEVAITPFGSDGPLADIPSSDLVQFAMSGYMHMTGNADGRPIRPTAPMQTLLHGSNQAFAAALLALRRRARTGEGAVIDQSMRDTGLWMLTHTYQHWDMQRVNLKRQGQNRDMGAKKRIRNVFESADGHVVWMFGTGHIASRGVDAFIAWMAEHGMAPDWLRTIDWLSTDLLAEDPSLSDRIEATLAAFLKTRTGVECLEFAIANGLMMAPANNLDGVLADAQLKARDSWRIVDLPGLGKMRVPGPPVRIRGVEWSPREVAFVGTIDHGDAPERPESAPAGALPLAGIRILDFGTTLAAPTAARHMADFGAEVIKVESHTHPDTLRVSTPYKDGIAGVDRSGYFSCYNAGKQSFALDLRHSGAKDIVRGLVQNADVLLENFAPGVMARFGLTPELLHEWNPRLVIASHSLQGQTGPRSRHRGYGQIASGLTGWYELTGEEGGPPLGPYSAYTDFLSWPLLLSAVLIALRARELTGEGQYIDHAQIESSLHFLAPVLLQAEGFSTAVTREADSPWRQTREGNKGQWPPLAVSNTYRCAGDEDTWIAVSVERDDQWQTFCHALGLPELAADPRFPRVVTSKMDQVPISKTDLDAQYTALDAELDAIFATISADEALKTLRAAGITVGIVARASDLFADLQLAHRGTFVRRANTILGDHAVLTPSFRISGIEPGPPSAAPALGEHTFDLANALLGLDADSIAELVANGVFN